MKILIGCDPEVFVKNPNSGEFVAATGLVPGDKKNPHKVPFGAVQVDGMALEINIDPAEYKFEFLDNINRVYHRLENLVPGYTLVKEPVAEFSKEYFDTLPPETLVLGCDPDFNAWTGLTNDRPETNAPFRTAAGHIHIGWTHGLDIESSVHFADCREIVKQLDYYLGIYSLLWDKDNRRRSLYGKAGAFRPKSYGVEYRVPSNAWLRSSGLIGWVYDACQKAVADITIGCNLPEIYGDAAEGIINRNEGDWMKYWDIHEVTGLALPPVEEISIAA